MKDNLTLIEPCEEMRDEFAAFAAAFADVGEDGIPGAGGVSVDSFDESLLRACQHARGENVGERVPASTHWLVRDGEIIGTCNLRYELNDMFRESGGHVGYSVRPGERCKGYGTWMLRWMLDRARELGISRAMVTCDQNNLASAGVIERNGGVLEYEGPVSAHDGILKRYWIEL